MARKQRIVVELYEEELGALENVVGALEDRLQNRDLPETWRSEVELLRAVIERIKP